MIKKKTKPTTLKDKNGKKHYTPTLTGKTESKNQIKTKYCFICWEFKLIIHFKECFFIIRDFI